MKISYAIPVCNEHEELKRLLEFLHQNIEENDEIVVQCDQGNTTPEVYEVLGTWQGGPLKVIEFPLKGDFSSFSLIFLTRKSNNLFNSSCSLQTGIA